MKVIGLIGGVSWESSLEYYRLINQGVRDRLGPQRSAKLIMYSLDFAPVAQLEHDEKWSDLADLLADVAMRIAQAGANLLIIASNTLHRVAPEVQNHISIPLLHIADAVAEEITSAGITCVGLVGTRFVMEQDFYRQRLSDHGLKVVIPDSGGRNEVHRIIYDELATGRVLDTSRQNVLGIINRLEQGGAEAVVLANTELPLLIRSGETSVILFDSLAIHATKAVLRAISHAI
jgi:aspartate racemase